MGNDKVFLGKTSLWTSISGIVLPVCLAAILFVFLPPPGYAGLAYVALCLILSVILELVAVGCGIAAMRTATGKTGLVISSILLVVVIIVLGLFFPPCVIRVGAGWMMTLADLMLCPFEAVAWDPGDSFEPW
jgi:hypothetical protein